MPAKYKKRPDGRYCTHVAIGLKPDGTSQRKTVYAKTIRELEEKAAELRRQVGIGAVVDSGGVTLGEWADTWLKSYKTGVEYNTYSMYRFMVESYIKKLLGSMRLKDVKTMHLQQVVMKTGASLGL